MAKRLKRRRVVETLLADRGDLLVIGGLGAPAWDITAAGDHPNNFPMWGAMGGAAVLGLGLALAQPKRNVLVVTGDGEMLMGIGSLATIGISKAPNLSIVVLDNEAYGETGQQDTATKHGVSLSGIARACAMKDCRDINTMVEVQALRDRIHQGGGSLFAQIKIDPEKIPLVLPPRDSTFIKNRMRVSILGQSALHD
ncbi:MAG: thiamine pyrophosphate-dependent enzyme [Burkholderiales bacterium]|jgi:thiamine pyrophosphate-dependent acetolactate synthase large subunit-like protein|nr:aldehyde dehydrogenase [Burkholderiaceae bacterium]NBS82049.1 aldehyde dehydrogenase [Betaproteobacteria bacterium]NBT98862.1 aldehyde dehydrogenase [Betaproteobacteria bacterium]NCX03567.1 aldehyde dehydrogenase [Betaproteobacteria bacterium]NDE31347.1 aldehyde dehydrogenase [Betaproteobacteria bacterium]